MEEQPVSVHDECSLEQCMDCINHEKSGDNTGERQTRPCKRRFPKCSEVE